MDCIIRWKNFKKVDRSYMSASIYLINVGLVRNWQHVLDKDSKLQSLI